MNTRLRALSASMLLVLVASLAACGASSPAHPHAAPIIVKYTPPESAATPEVVHSNGEVTLGAPAAPPTTISATPNEKHISDRGLALVEQFEGFSSCVYRDAVGVYTIGYGEAYVSPNRSCESRATAQANLRGQIERNYEWSIRALGVNFNQNQWDALVSFDYNLGAGIFEISPSLNYDLRHRQFYAASQVMRSYDRAGGRVLAGLATRRAEEVALFLKPEAAPKPETTAQKRARLKRELGADNTELEKLRHRIVVLRREMKAKECYPRFKHHKAGPTCRRWKSEGDNDHGKGNELDAAVKKLKRELG